MHFWVKHLTSTLSLSSSRSFGVIQAACKSQTGVSGTAQKIPADRKYLLDRMYRVSEAVQGVSIVCTAHECSNGVFK